MAGCVQTLSVCLLVEPLNPHISPDPGPLAQLRSRIHRGGCLGPEGTAQVVGSGHVLSLPRPSGTLEVQPLLLSWLGRCSSKPHSLTSIRFCGCPG